MSATVQHGKVYPEAPRARDVPATPTTALTASDRDPVSGRFQPGNRAARGRTLRRLAKALPWLDPEQCEPWVRPYITSAREHAADLTIELEGVGSLVGPLAEELATARLVYRGLLQLGLAGDAKALDAARAWLRESRQHALTLEALARQHRDQKPPHNALHAAILSAGSNPKDPQL